MVKAKSPIASQLSSAVKSAWTTPEGQALEERLSSQAYNSGYASCLEEGARRNEPFSEVAKRCARQTGLSAEYSADWGSPKQNMPRRVVNVQRI